MQRNIRVSRSNGSLPQPNIKSHYKESDDFSHFFFFLLKTLFHFVFLCVESRLMRKCGIVFEEQLSAKPVLSSISKPWELVTS